MRRGFSTCTNQNVVGMGYTQWIDALSSYCANAVKKSLSVSKIGHSGILDSYAEGVLLLAIGKSTHLLPVSFLRSFEI